MSIFRKHNGKNNDCSSNFLHISHAFETFEKTRLQNHNQLFSNINKDFVILTAFPLQKLNQNKIKTENLIFFCNNVILNFPICISQGCNSKTVFEVLWVFEKYCFGREKVL